MDSFAEPRKPLDISVSLSDVRGQVAKLEADLRKKDIPLSGRIIHVSHYLPITCAFARRPRPQDIPSPPATPPAKASDIPPSPSTEQPPSGDLPAPTATAPAQQHESPQWTLNVRYGHSAMVSGIDSLAATHEQLFVGWTGDIESVSQAGPPLAAPNSSGPSDPPISKVPTASLSDADKKELENLLENYRSRDEVEEGKEIHYVPVFLDDKDAHGHYDGYCKQSECTRSSASLFDPLFRITLLSLTCFRIFDTFVPLSPPLATSTCACLIRRLQLENVLAPPY